MQQLEHIRQWEQPHCGLHWWQMPGSEEVDKKLNHALFRRGKIRIEEAVMEVEHADGGRIKTSVGVSVRRIKGGGLVRSKAPKNKQRLQRSAMVTEAHDKKQHLTTASSFRIGLTDEQMALIAQYRSLSDQLKSMSRPREVLKSACARLGMQSNRVQSGIDRRTRWTPKEIAIVADAMQDLVTLGNRAAEMLETVKALWAEWMTPIVRGVPITRGARKELMAACNISGQVLEMMSNNPQGLSVPTLTELEIGLRRCIDTGRHHERRLMIEAARMTAK